MIKTIYLLLFIFMFSSCVEEYDIFYPYRNPSLSYMQELKNQSELITFDIKSKFEFTFDNGLSIEIPANSFLGNLDSAILLLDIQSSIGDFIGNRTSLILKNNKLFSSQLIINFDILDNNNNSISLIDNSKITFKVPYEELNIPELIQQKSDFWEKVNSEDFNVLKSTWYIGGNENPYLQKGYIVKTNLKGTFCLGETIHSETSISELSINLPENFTVNNSIVYISLKELNSNIELFWNSEKNVFALPPNIILPENSISIIALSEDSDLNTFFGMKYAQVKNGETINLELNRRRIEEIRSVLDTL